MRVTTEMMAASSLRRLSTRLASYERTQTQLSTGRRFQVASEDVGASVRAQSLRASLRLREQEARNAADARSWLDIADNQLQGGVTTLQRVRDLAVRGASQLAPDEGRALALEVDALKQQLLGIANARYRDRPLFGGNGTDAPVQADGGTYTAVADPGRVERRVGEHDVVQVNVTAWDAFGFGRGEGMDVFRTLDVLAADLRAGDAAGVSAGIARLDTARDDLSGALAVVGSRTNRVDAAQSRSESTLHAIRVELAEVEDVDIAAAVMDLQVQEVAYQATLQAMARALPPSLASFLR